jgi:hypothetical protein
MRNLKSVTTNNAAIKTALAVWCHGEQSEIRLQKKSWPL